MCPRRSKILRLVKSANPRYPKGKAYRSTVIGSIGPHFCSAICSALLTLSGPAKPTAGNTKSNTICIARILYLSTIYLIVSSTMAGDCSLTAAPTSAIAAMASLGIAPLQVYRGPKELRSPTNSLRPFARRNAVS